MPMLRHTNEVNYFYVITRARLKLYSYLDTLKERATYCDRFLHPYRSAGNPHRYLWR